MEDTADLDSCSREPIHIPEAIQAHGYLFALEEKTGHILQFSSNCVELLQINPDQLVGRPVESILQPSSVTRFREALKSDELSRVNPLPLEFKTAEAGAGRFDGILHRNSQALILELERPKREAEVSFLSFFHSVRQASSLVQAAQSLDAVLQSAAEQVKHLTGFDRVLIYRFEEDWTGITMAEVREPHMDSYLGLRFPASDIPEQARRLYTRNWLRLIPDAHYTPIRIIPNREKPLDLSQSVLRSVSPVHVEYMRNMGTIASMSISIMKDDKLWGLISCHHSQARFVDFQERAACEFIGQVLSQQLDAIEGRSDLAYRQELKETHNQLLSQIAQLGLTPAFKALQPDWCSLTAADGGAIIGGDHTLLFGKTPPSPALDQLMVWLRKKEIDRIYSTNHLKREFKDADSASSAGLIAIPLTKRKDVFLLWFRAEIVRTVLWAGKPEKEARSAAGEPLRLHPRKSFQAWEETRRDQADAWQTAELDAALDLRNSVISEELARSVEELAESNSELDSFATIASHDLKEPMRGIRNYANFILEDDEDRLSNKAVERLHQIQDLSTRTETLLIGLYQYSRAGRTQLALQKTDLNVVLKDVFTRLYLQIQEKNVAISMPTKMPTLYCDSIRIGEVFYNLIANGIKYNDKSAKIIEIGYVPQEPAVLYVEDNGIGVPADQRDEIFKIFRRLHEAEAYGGGTGSGLAIVRKIIDRHGGRIWVQSSKTGGTRFCFSLSRALSQCSRI